MKFKTYFGYTVRALFEVFFELYSAIFYSHFMIMSLYFTLSVNNAQFLCSKKKNQNKTNLLPLVTDCFKFMRFSHAAIECCVIFFWMNFWFCQLYLSGCISEMFMIKHILNLLNWNYYYFEKTCFCLCLNYSTTDNIDALIKIVIKHTYYTHFFGMSSFHTNAVFLCVFHTLL